MVSAASASVSSGLKFPSALMSFDFQPSIGIVARDIDRLGIDIRSFKEPLTRAVRRIMMPSILQNFVAQGRPDPWAPLSDATWEKRAKDGYEGGSILVKTGNLYKVASSFKVWKIGTGAAAVVGLPGAEYGGYHQSGYGSKPSTVGSGRAGLEKVLEDIKNAMATGEAITSNWKPWAPARPFILFQDEDLRAIDLIFLEWLSERAIAVGRFDLV